jgi:hypothetical protein
VPALIAAAALPLPELLAALPREFGPYVTLVLLGFVIGVIGHLTRSRWLVTIGVLLIFIGAFLLPLVLKSTTNDEPPPPPSVSAGRAG